MVIIACIFDLLAHMAIHFLAYFLASRTMCNLARLMSMPTFAYASILHLALHCSLHVTVVRVQTIIVNVHKLNVHFVKKKMIMRLTIRIYTVDTSIYGRYARYCIYGIYATNRK